MDTIKALRIFSIRRFDGATSVKKTATNEKHARRKIHRLKWEGL